MEEINVALASKKAKQNGIKWGIVTLLNADHCFPSLIVSQTKKTYQEIDMLKV